MKNKALVVIDIQNDITKNYKEIIENINKAVDWAVASDIPVVYIKHNNLSAGTRTYNMTKGGYIVHVLSDCITSYDKRKINEMLQYYESKGCIVEKLSEVM